MEEEARQAKLASGQAGMSSQEREKIQQIVEQVFSSKINTCLTACLTGS